MSIPVKNDTEGEKVGSLVDRSFRKLLWSHVVKAPDDLFGLCESRINHMCDAKVHDFRVPVESHQYVGGLDVAMDNSLRVRVCQSVEKLACKS